MKRIIAVSAIVLAGITACGTTKTVTRTLPGPTVSVTQTVPGPTQTATVTTSAPPPAAGTSIGQWSGTGNQATPQFNVPSSGNYVVSWSYSGNTDPTIGGGTNFSISDTNSGADSICLPNDIASSGSGSCEVTGASGTDSFNTQAIGQWTITVKSAP